MEPTLKSGERVWVDTADIRPSADGLYAIRNQLGGVIVKRLHLDPRLPRVKIISDNPHHPASEVGLDEISIIGKVKCGLRMF
jgi:phage repressor protein C with HTH and peptisase S24 domain